MGEAVGEAGGDVGEEGEPQEPEQLLEALEPMEAIQEIPERSDEHQRLGNFKDGSLVHARMAPAKVTPGSRWQFRGRQSCSGGLG